MTPEMGGELLELRAHFGIGAVNALGLPGAQDPLPAWEYDLLVGSLAHIDQPAEDQDDEPDVEVPFEAEAMLEPPVPEALRGM